MGLANVGQLAMGQYAMEVHMFPRFRLRLYDLPWVWYHGITTIHNVHVYD